MIMSELSLRLFLLVSVLTNAGAQTTAVNFMTGTTDTGEECFCEVSDLLAETGAPEKPIAGSDVVLSNVECNPDDIATCQANCEGLHGKDQYLADKCCAYVGQSASLLAFEEDSLWVPRLEEFNRCTGARVRLEYLPEGEDGMADALRQDLGDDVSHDQGNAEGQGIFDAYIVQAPWLWPVVNGLDNLTPRIRESADTVKFLDINPASRAAVSYNGTVRALPLDTDYIALGWRQDVFHKYQIPERMTPPRTIQDLAFVAEKLHGLDFNEDGEGDWGVCLTPQVNYFHAFVAPLMQTNLNDPENGLPTGQNMFFAADTFEPLIRQPAFKTAVETYYKIIRNSNCGEQLSNGEKCDRKTAFPTGRCAMVISMPGTLTKMLLDGAKYAPQRRVDDTTGEVLWDINNMTLGGGGTYWGRRAPFPGSTVVQKWDRAAGYPLVECSADNGRHCPLADENGVNNAPFFAEGGEAYALNGRQAKPAARAVMWDLFTWLSELPETALPLSGQYRKSHLNEEHREVLTDEAGWPNQMVDDIFNLLGKYFKSEDEGGNPVQDLLMLGFPEYMGALDEELHDKFLGVKTDSTGGVFNRNDPVRSVDPYLDHDSYNEAYTAFIDALEERYHAISASISGGRMGQLQRWRSSLNLPLRTEEELCFATLSSNQIDAFVGLKCATRVSFDSLCQTQPDIVANYDVQLCDSLKSDSNLAVVIPSIVIPLIIVAVIGAYIYGEKKKQRGDNVWQIDPDELIYKDPIEVIGHGKFGEVVLAEYRGTTVAVKTVNPARLVDGFHDEEQPGISSRISISSRNSKSMKSVPLMFGGAGNGTSSARSSLGSGSAKVKMGTGSAKVNRGTGSAKVNRGTGSAKVGRGTGSAKLTVGTGSAKTRGSSSSRGIASITASGLASMTKTALGLTSVTQEAREMREEFIAEIRLLANLQEHRNIVCVMGAVVNGTHEPKLVLEYMERGSLFDLLHNANFPISGELIHNILTDVIQGVRFLHNAKPHAVIHSDLKSSNILIDERWRAKVADFGWGTAGTPYWTAPEVLRQETLYTPESDVYAVGVVLYEMYSRSTPYEGEDYDTVLKKVADPAIRKRPPAPTTMSSSIADMMRDCLRDAPEERPTLNELGSRISRLSMDDIEYQVQGDGPGSQIMFPENVARALSKGHSVDIQTHENVSVVYCEIIGFSALTAELPPLKIADMLQRLHDHFDVLSDKHSVFKVDVLGSSSWMGATNCVQHQPDHTARMAKFVIEAIEAAGTTLIDEDNPERGYVQIQTAMISGEVKAKVVGTRSPRYSLFGPIIEAVTYLAGEKSEAGKIVCTEREQGVLERRAPEIPVLIKSRVFIPGFGATLTFWVNEKN
ncbi:activated protein kinase catalytic subunit alpha-1 [Seminavis robusta]|uniref:guanylate cyclase n=1 Tax=Seminavis robusta TaxID=568900 RepID=A0A9N8F1P5_9STRA|nr:activated protein kinase catalytic subunit alpha-1 [Seminavis robusta]|eukprot:Sro2562_g331340.1 activated protein kinase catalytic subunit alpha-1 (1352) ;mRNA; f:4212-8541